MPIHLKIPVVGVEPTLPKEHDFSLACLPIPHPWQDKYVQTVGIT